MEKSEDPYEMFFGKIMIMIMILTDEKLSEEATLCFSVAVYSNPDKLDHVIFRLSRRHTFNVRVNYIQCIING